MPNAIRVVTRDQNHFTVQVYPTTPVTPGNGLPFYHINAGEIYHVPARRQLNVVGELIIEGELRLDGELNILA